jgi:hypothetical protein
MAFPSFIQSSFILEGAVNPESAKDSVRYRSGATLSEIGQLLRHENHDTTRIYAKVDIDALRTLSLPWPGGVQRPICAPHSIST